MGKRCRDDEPQSSEKLPRESALSGHLKTEDCVGKGQVTTSPLLQRATFVGLRGGSKSAVEIDLGDSDEEEPAVAAEGVLQADSKAKTEHSARQWFLLRLPPLFEALVDTFRRFSLAYISCIHLPRSARTAARLWELAALAGDWEIGVRRLLYFADDTFVLQWPWDPISEDPAGLKGPRDQGPNVLCVSYCGPGKRMHNRLIGRRELQLRRRLIAYLNDGYEPKEETLPLCDLPPTT
mmetsp:Transcript_36967/g.81176  ORF Transcript_36967/g.81176 Transcript_36967/m.81176 type:complete len:237 (-) Transcript_36967:318-1028(-)